MALPPTVRTVRDANGELYLNAEDLRHFVQDRDVVYHCGCLLKVHMDAQERTGALEPGWKGAVTTILGGMLMLATGKAEVITDPDGEPGRN